METDPDGFATVPLQFNFRIGTKTVCQMHFQVAGRRRNESSRFYRSLLPSTLEYSNRIKAVRPC